MTYRRRSIGNSISQLVDRQWRLVTAMARRWRPLLHRDLPPAVVRARDPRRL